MKKKYLTGKRILFAALAILVISGLFVVNYLVSKNFPGGKFFLTQWTATRAVLLEHESPYSPGTLYQIQNNVYARPAMSGEYEFRFNYPYYVMAIFIPVSLIKDYPIARAFWMLFLELLVLVTFIECFNISNWKPNLRIGIVLFLFFATGYHTLRAIIDGNLIILTTLFLVLVIISIRNRSDEFAGIFLAGLTAQIQFFIIPIIVFSWFAVQKRRLNILWYFLGTLTILAGFSFLFQPDWINSYVQQLWLSMINNPFGSIITMMSSQYGELGTRIGVTISIFASILILVEWILVRKNNLRSFIWFIFFLIGTSLFCGLPADIGNFYLLLPGLIFILSVTSNRWTMRGELIVFIVSIVLFSGTWSLFFIQQGKVPDYSETAWYYGFIPVIEITLLYWSKWWIQKHSTVA